MAGSPVSKSGFQLKDKRQRGVKMSSYSENKRKKTEISAAE